MDIHPGYKELFELLNNADVEYLVAGDYVLAYYGISRYTCDIDVYVKPTVLNARNVMKALNHFGF